jgi:hypothetical protein
MAGTAHHSLVHTSFVSQATHYAFTTRFYICYSTKNGKGCIA